MLCLLVTRELRLGTFSLSSVVVPVAALSLVIGRTGPRPVRNTVAFECLTSFVPGTAGTCKAVRRQYVNATAFIKGKESHTTSVLSVRASLGRWAAGCHCMCCCLPGQSRFLSGTLHCIKRPFEAANNLFVEGATGVLACDVCQWLACVAVGRGCAQCTMIARRSFALKVIEYNSWICLWGGTRHDG
jgi:hypothetical protein